MERKDARQGAKKAVITASSFLQGTWQVGSRCVQVYRVQVGWLDTVIDGRIPDKTNGVY